MHPNDQASIERACARLIAKYAYLNDERRFEELALLFTEDAILFRPSAPDTSIKGRAAILEAFRKRPADTLTFHVCSDVVIDVETDAAASGCSRILMLSAPRSPQGGAMPGETKPPVPGVFRDRFMLTKSGWKFAERRGIFWI